MLQFAIHKLTRHKIVETERSPEFFCTFLLDATQNIITILINWSSLRHLHFQMQWYVVKKKISLVLLAEAVRTEIDWKSSTIQAHTSHALLYPFKNAA